MNMNYLCKLISDEYTLWFDKKPKQKQFLTSMELFTLNVAFELAGQKLILNIVKKIAFNIFMAFWIIFLLLFVDSLTITSNYSFMILVILCFIIAMEHYFMYRGKYIWYAFSYNIYMWNMYGNRSCRILFLILKIIWKTIKIVSFSLFELYLFSY